MEVVPVSVPDDGTAATTCGRWRFEQAEDATFGGRAGRIASKGWNRHLAHR